LERITPELALIDPEWARADLARLDALARLELPAAPERREAQVGERRPHGRVLAVLAGLSLAANGVLLAIVVAGGGTNALAKGAPATPSSTQGTTQPGTMVPPSIGVNAAIEQRILALVVKSPKGKLPPTLVDQRTGLAKNNLQAVCNSAPSNSLLCLVRPAQHQLGEGMLVRYRPTPDGRGSFVWYPYRSG